MRAKVFVSLLFLLCANTVRADFLGSGPERGVTVDPVYQDSGNTWRVLFTSATSGYPVLISSAPERAVQQSSATTSLGIPVYRDRYVINTCTTSVMALSPTDVGFNVFSSTFMVALSSAGSGTSAVGPSNARHFNHQDAIWAIWAGPVNGACLGGALVEESYYNPLRKR